jgi:nucleoside-diphosphate-sugar epimerase
VENLADGIVLAGTHPKAAGDAFIITDGVEMSWKIYFEKLTSALNLPAPRWSIHPKAVQTLARIMESIHRLFRIKSRPLVTKYLADHLCGDFHFSIEKAKRQIGYEPKVDVDEAIRRTAQWYRQVVRGE